MFTNFTVTQREENDIKAEQVSLYTIQNQQWLSWMSCSKNIYLQTQYKEREIALGKCRMRVDGWDSVKRMAYQLYGCMFHGHPPNAILLKAPKADTFLVEL